MERLIKLLHELDAGIEVLGHAETVKSTVWWLQNNPAPDLLLLDIELADGQCFEIFRQIDVQVPVIFTTSYDEYALNAFKVNSVDYLLKPIRKEELAQSLAKLQRIKTLYGGKESALNVDKLIASLSGFQPRNNIGNAFWSNKAKNYKPSKWKKSRGLPPIQKFAFCALGKISVTCLTIHWRNCPRC
nr:response regulator [Haliscomenobacter sp.]